MELAVSLFLVLMFFVVVNARWLSRRRGNPVSGLLRFVIALPVTVVFVMLMIVLFGR